MNPTERFALSKDERKQLKAALQGYGKLEYASKVTGLHVNTLRMINLRGTGVMATITAIRENLIGSDTKVENELQKAS